MMHRMGWYLRRAVVSLSMLLVVPVAAHAQQTHLLLIGGLSGDAALRTPLLESLVRIRQTALERWRVPVDQVIVLTEDSLPPTEPAGLGWNGRSTKAAIGERLGTLSRRVAPGDLLMVVLLGNGSGEGAASKVNLPGPDATAAEYAAWLAPFNQQQLLFVNMATGSGDFVPALAAPGRIVIAATRTALERNSSEFHRFFTEAFGSDAADANKDGQLSALELFRAASAAVARSYSESNRLLTEHAVISDSVAAANLMLGAKSTVTDPRVRALIVERQALETELAAWRARKANLPTAEYDAGLERLLLAIAEKTRAIRAAGGGKQ